jgi:hypothetical protein
MLNRYSHRLQAVLCVIVLSLVGCKEEKTTQQDKNTPASSQSSVSVHVGQVDSSGHMKLNPFFMEGKPLDATCFSQLIWDKEGGNSEDPPLLTSDQCSKKSFNAVLCEGEKDCTSSEDKEVQLDQGCASSKENCYAWTRSFGDAKDQGQIIYTSLGMYKQKPVVLVQESTGGSGYFYSLMTLNIQGSKIAPDEIIAAGDRCTGGIPEASAENGKLIYRQFVTPSDLLGLLTDPENEKKNQSRMGRISGENLISFASSAIACAGQAHYEDQNFMGVVIDRAFLKSDLKEWQEDKNSPQAVVCFDQKLIDFTKDIKPLEDKSEDVFLTSAQYEKFLDVFDSECLKSQSPSEGEPDSSAQDH